MVAAEPSGAAGDTKAFAKSISGTLVPWLLSDNREQEMAQLAGLAGASTSHMISTQMPPSPEDSLTLIYFLV